MNLESTASVAQIISVIIPVLAGFFAWKLALDKRDEEQAKRIALVQLKLDMIEKQFGPNGGGMREAINRISAMLEKMDERVLELVKEHAELVGHVSSCPVPTQRKAN